MDKLSDITPQQAAEILRKIREKTEQERKLQEDMIKALAMKYGERRVNNQ